MENNSQIEGKPMPMEPNVFVNVDSIPDWHPTLLEKSRSRRDPILRTKNISLNSRLQIKSSPSFKSSNINNLLNDDENKNIFDNNNNMDMQNEIINQNIDKQNNNSSYDDMNDNSSESYSTNDDSKSIIEWMNAKQKKSQSVPRNFERINLNSDNSSPIGSPMRNMDSKKRKEFEKKDINNDPNDKNWTLSPNLKNLEKQNTVWVDISCILHLPQKEASRVLGISGSLLCKRYKESTNNRKWPHRMMKKVRKEMTDPQTEDNEQKDPKMFRQLQRMKEHCSKPARIRLTRPVECHDDDYVLVNGPAKNTLILLPKNQSHNYQISSPSRNGEDSKQMVDDSNFEDFNF
eukprot:TRINITY_DN926_c0_g1_i1.p1 TRINITY_DN926_c0_g1~~TRINITY_DN926_c0_g1_i1.p1  ORF type:complete len:347 (-),score=75.79 TRINITY_DN926_c0_g1_i1:67-1107(-)